MAGCCQECKARNYFFSGRLKAASSREFISADGCAGACMPKADGAFCCACCVVGACCGAGVVFLGRPGERFCVCPNASPPFCFACCCGAGCGCGAGAGCGAGNGCAGICCAGAPIKAVIG